MKYNVSTPESWKTILEFEIPVDEFDSSVSTKLVTYSKKIKLDGFRKGKVPRKVVEARFGKSVRAEVVEEIIQKSYEGACKEKGITPVSEPRMSNLKVEEGKPLTFTVETEIDPVIEIKGYDKLKVRPSTRRIKKGDVNEALESLRLRLAEFTDVERSVQKGDFVSFEYQKVVVDGEEKKDLNSPGYPIEIGESKIKEFDKGMIGHKAGETVSISIKFPGDYGDAELAGKRSEMTILIKKVQEKKLPEVNAEFLKKIGEFADEAALRAFLETDLQQRELQRARSEACTKAVDQLLDKNKFDVPPSRVERYLDLMHEEMQRYARSKEEVPPREEMGEKYRATAERTMKRYRLIDFIAAKEKISPTQEEVDAEIKKLSDRYGKPFDEVKEELRRNGTVARIRSDLREQKTLNFLIGEPEVDESGE